MRVGRRLPPDPGAGDPPALGPMLAEPRRALAWAGIAFAAAVVLCLLVWNTTTREVIQTIDDAWLDLMEALRWAPIVDLAKALDFLGGTICNWTIRFVVIGILIYRRQWLSLGAFVLAIVVSEAMIGPVKALYDRPRPPDGLVGTSGASFPSGHALSTAVTAVGVVIVLIPPGHKRWVWERRAALYAALMALSRTYLGAHWLSDVVAGGLLGCAVAIACPALLVDLRVRVRATRRDRDVSRRSAAAGRLALGVAVLTAATLPTRRSEPPRLELDTFEAVNGLPDALYPPLWPLMQFGALAAVPVTAAAVWARGDRDRARRLLVSGTATWALAKGVKRLVRRGRPAAVGPVVVRGQAQSGDGFVSGHAAVSVALAAGAMRTFHALDPVLAILASTVGVSRMYVGAHLPLDVLGGAALGLMVDAAVELAWPG